VSLVALEVENLAVAFRMREGEARAVDGVSFALARGETLCILGESGSGKSVTLKALMRLLPPRVTRQTGRIAIDGQDVMAMDAGALSAARGKLVSMVFQEPMVALDPVFTIGAQIEETIRRHDGLDGTAARTRARELLEMVQIPSAASRLKSYPHEMSGGMRQRAMIALALACRPKVLLADEPTTALDVTVQIQILLLLRSLQRELGMSMVFVTHDIGVAVEIADHLAVMYAGRFVERGALREVLRSPAHPYTQGLLASTVHGAMRGRRLEAIPGAPPDLLTSPTGCSFAPRCRAAATACLSTPPDEVALGPGRAARCVLLNEAA
jgi:peptide/nickel transport system ATP-binding protein